jgi:hypothetical protein
MRSQGTLSWLVAFAAVASLALAANASAEIVYTKDAANGSAELWAMNDDGSGQHVLIAWNAIAPNDSVFGANLLPTSSTLVFVGHTDEYDHVGYGNDGTNYEGIYELVNGVATRISAPPEDTPGVASSDGSPTQTADGRVVYDQIVASFDSSGDVTAGSESLLVRPLSGGSPSTWTTTPPPAIHLGAFAADPVDATLLAYESGSNPNELEIGNQSGSSTPFTVAQPNGAQPAWSPNGQELVDVDGTPPPGAGGFDAGLWLFYGSSDRELLVDPNPNTQYSISSLSDPTFAGANEILFGAEGNIWEIPASCDMCTLATNAKELTTDGTSAHPDSQPAWTSTTIVPLGGGTQASLKAGVTAPAGQRTLQQKGLSATVECSLACEVGVVGAVQISGSHKVLRTKSVVKLVAANHPTKITVTFTASTLSAVRTALAHHKRVTAQVDIGAETAKGGGREIYADSKPFAVKQ